MDMAQRMRLVPLKDHDAMDVEDKLYEGGESEDDDEANPDDNDT